MELIDAKGEHDGEIHSAYLGKKISYFKCEANHGLYIKSINVTINYISQDISNDDDNKISDNGKDEEIQRLKEQLEMLQNVS